MRRPGLEGLTAAVLAAGVLLGNVVAAPAARADSPGLPPLPALTLVNPTVTGKLVARATGTSSPGPVNCGVSPMTRAATVTRGLVICTADGRLVLLQLSPSTGIFNRDGQRMGYGALVLGDRLNAWGTVRDGGARLYPTAAIQDLSRGGAHFQTVTGRLIARPDQGPTGQVICGDRDRTMAAQTEVSRGLVICTAEGRLILLQISGTTKLLTHDRARLTIEDLSLGDTVIGTGTLRDAGLVMDPSVSIADANLLLGKTNSQDFIAGGGAVLTLYVLSSDAGPVQGRVLASPGEPTHIRVCGGAQGTWADLSPGLTVNVSRSVFNTRTMEYVDTSFVSIVSCG